MQKSSPNKESDTSAIEREKHVRIKIPDVMSQ